MKGISRWTIVRALLACSVCSILAAADADTVNLFKNAGQSASFFKKSYGYAVFPNIGKAGFVVGGAHGSGKVYAAGKQIGTTTMNQLSVGLQAGGQDYSEIVFFQDARSLKEFTSGSFEFGADAGVVVITSGASVSAGTTGESAGASGGKKDASSVGSFHKGMAIFTIVKGGLMYSASLAGQKFSYTPLPPK